MPSTSHTRTYFDEHAGRLEAASLIDKWPAIALLFTGVPAGARVLECGAGTGLYTATLAGHGYHVTAVDLSAASLESARTHVARAGVADRVETRVGDFVEVVRAMPPAYDVVTFIKVLHHFPDLDAIARALASAVDAIDGRGRIVVFEPSGTSPVWPVVYRIRRRWEAERNTRLIRRRRLESVFASRTGVRVTSGYRFLVPGTVATRHRWLDAVDRFLCRVPGLRALAGNVWLVVDVTRPE